MENTANKTLLFLIIIVVVLSIVFTWKALDITNDYEKTKQSYMGYDHIEGEGTGMVAINLVSSEKGAE